MTLRKRTDLIVVHVTATPPHMKIGAERIDQMHKRLGWSGIGYHYVIRRDGSVEPGRDLNSVGAHVAGFNSRSVGISLVGGVNDSGKAENNATLGQFAALEELVRQLQESFPGAGVCGHRDLSPDTDGDGVIEPHEYLKACPCFDVIPWASARGLKPVDIVGQWGNAERGPKPDGGEARTAYLQRLLARAGYAFGPVDGIVGPKTHQAIRDLQHDSGVRSSGKFDDATVAFLRNRFEQRPAA